MAKMKMQLGDMLKTAMKARDKDTLDFTRNLHAAVKKTEIDTQKELDDAGVQKIAGSLIKQRKESIEQFKKGGREDLVTREEAELKFLMQFLPEQLSEDEVRTLVDQAIAETEAKELRDMGKVMKNLMPKIQGRTDTKWVNTLLREKLEG